MARAVATGDLIQHFQQPPILARSRIFLDVVELATDLGPPFGRDRLRLGRFPHGELIAFASMKATICARKAAQVAVAPTAVEVMP